ncbi:MAG: right-handed parallel beta-helix repeat-containing protein [Kiritimatiellae bacterium]|nr:right-handed parallel beta-helix repeat-containing protein [Kiritimatiellia bacterium]
MRTRHRIIVACFILGLPGLAAGATYTVTSSADSGGGTLRWAITAANTNPGADTIEFNLAAPYRIQPASALPTSYSSGLIIDGTTQPGFAGTPLVTIEGSLAGAADGLLISDSTSAVVRALNISKWSGNGITLRRGLSTRVENCRISSNTVNGIILETSRRCVIGGAGPLLRNVITSNGNAGVYLSGDHNLVLGNLVGTDGLTAQPNDHGVQVLSGQSNLIGGAAAGEGNVISGNRSFGVYLVQWASNTTVIGNYIGTDVSGTAAISNVVGIVIEGARHTIGGLVAAERNLISGNTWGMRLIGGRAHDNVVRGNWIGLGATGAVVSNSLQGVQIMQGASTNLIGGAGAAHRNVISGNGGGGVALTEAESRANRIQGNYIGLGPDGISLLGNGDNGIRVSAPWTLVGGSGAGEGNTIMGNGADGVSVSGANAIGNRIEGNVIAHNGARGVSVWDSGAVSNLITANSLYLNIDLGIDLGNNGRTPNDTQDPDTGPNQLQNYPVLTLASNAGATMAIGGYLDSTPGTAFVIEFFGNSGCDATGYGEGEVLLGTQAVVTDGAGMAGFTNSVLPTPTPPPSFVTATARHTLRQETSEFSRYLMVDSDGDGMPDGWEYANFGSATGGDPAGHGDTDTIPNLEEFIADTDPNDATDYPRFVGIAPDSGAIRVDVQTAATRSYRLEDVPRAGSGTWGGRFTDKPGTGGPVSWYWGYADSNAMFRCRVLLP